MTSDSAEEITRFEGPQTPSFCLLRPSMRLRLMFTFAFPESLLTDKATEGSEGHTHTLCVCDLLADT